MRFYEIKKAIAEANNFGDYIEDDATNATTIALIEVLHELQTSSQHAEIPKISVEALVHLVKKQPGGETFNLEALNNAKKQNETVKNIIADIKDNEEGIKYVFIKPLEQTEETPEIGDEAEAIKTAPEKTVASMAKKALSARS